MENLEILKSTLSPETYARVEEETAKSTLKLADLSKGGYVSQSKYEALEAQLTNTQQLLESKSADYDSLKKTAGDNKELKDTIEQMQTAFETEKANLKNDYEAQLKKGKIAAQIVQDYHPKDVNDILAHIDMDKVTVDGDNLIGLKEQVDPLKEAKAYYFEAEATPSKTGFEHNEGGEDYSAIRKAFGLKNDTKKE